MFVKIENKILDAIKETNKLLTEEYEKLHEAFEIGDLDASDWLIQKLEKVKNDLYLLTLEFRGKI